MSLVAILKAAIIAVVVSVVCFLPPGIHFVSGPLAPLIGGYVAGLKARLSTGEAVVLGLIFSLGIGAPAPFLLSRFDVIPDLANAALVFFSVVGALYFGVLGGVAAAFGGKSAREQRSDAATTERR